MNKKLISTVAIAASALALVCTAALAQGHVWEDGRAGVEMKAGEFKLLLSQDLFKGSRADGFRAAWRRVPDSAITRRIKWAFPREKRKLIAVVNAERNSLA